MADPEESVGTKEKIEDFLRLRVDSLLHVKM